MFSLCLGETSHFVRNCSKVPPVDRRKRLLRVGFSSADTGHGQYLKARIGNLKTPVDCLIDSGCDQTIMPLGLIQKCGYVLTKTDKIVHSSNGATLDLAGETKTHVNIGNK